jgi:SAM-dependent methyltransferase
MSVEKLYSEWVYPEPVCDIEQAVSKGWYDFGDPSLIWSLYWSCKPYKSIDILIAGCGTHQAAYYAFKNPNCNVVGIDISTKSLEHQQYLKSKHNLSNLSLEKLSILDIDKKFAKSFDLIVSTGVIHHIDDTQTALVNLKSCLKIDGRINLMVYGKYPRLGVYMMQHVFKILKLDISHQGLGIAKSILQRIPEWHFVNEYIRKSGDLHSDAGIADTFLNPIDKSFSVKDLFQLIDQADLEFVDWNDRLHYSINALIKSDNLLQSLITDITDFEKYQLVELLVQQLATHRVILSLKGQSNRIQILDSDIDLIIPVLRYDLLFDQTQLSRGHQSLEIANDRYRILCEIDGTKSISDLINLVSLDRRFIESFLLELQDF